MSEPSPNQTSDRSRWTTFQTLILFLSRSRLSVALVLVAVFVLIGARLVWSYQHVRPPLVLGDGLEILFDFDDYGLERGYRVVEVNGTPVNDADAYHAALDALDWNTGERKRRVDLVFAGPTEANSDRHAISWYEVPRTARFEIDVEQRTVRLAPDDASEFGVALDDTITAVNGLVVADIVARELTPRDLIRTTMRFTVADASGATTHDVVVFVRDWRDYAIRFLTGLAFGILGIVPFWLKPGARTSLSFMVFCLVVTMFWLVRSIPFGYRSPTEDFLFQSFQALMPAASTYFFLTFTGWRLLVPSAKTLSIIVGAMSILGLSLVPLNHMYFPGDALMGLLSIPISLGLMITMLVLFLVALPVDWWIVRNANRIKAVDRQRGHVIRAATVFGFGPFLVYAVLRTTTHFTDNYGFLFELSVLLFPLIIAYAIVKHNLLRINELVREGLVLGTILAAFAGAYSLGTSLLIPVVESRVGDAQWIESAFVAGAVLLAFPMHARVRKFINARKGSLSDEYGKVFDKLSELSGARGSIESFCMGFLDRASQATQASGMAVLLRYPGDRQWAIAAMIPHPKSSETIDECDDLLQLLADTQSVLFRDDLNDSIEYGPIRFAVLLGMDALGATVVYPLVADGDLIGILSMGDRIDGRNYSAVEIRGVGDISLRFADDIHAYMNRSEDETPARMVDTYPLFPGRIGNYEIDGAVGEGGMSYVYRSVRNGMQYAVKVPKGYVQSSSALLERFHREGRALERLKHENIVKIMEVGSHGFEPYIAMEYLPGGTASELLKRNAGGLPEEQAISLVLDAARGLSFAYEQDVIHRDVKPGNMFLTADDRVKIGDFGLARISDETSISVAGEIFGTPGYMSPESFRGGQATWRSDQYALGISLYQLIAGTRPFKVDVVDAAIYRAMAGRVPDIRKVRPEVSSETAAIIRKMTERKPKKRFASYEELIASLERIRAREDDH